MRVCMLTTSFPRDRTDYAGLFIFRLCRAMATIGLKVSVVAPGGLGLRSTEEMGACQILRFSYFFPRRWQCLAYGPGGIPTNVRRNGWLLFQVPFFLLFFLIKAFKAVQKVDLIHAHWIYSGLIAWVIQYFMSIPYIVTLRGEDALRSQKGGIAHFISLAILKRAAGITTVNRNLKDWLISEGIPKEKITFIRNGVDLPDADRRTISSTHCRLIFVGSLIPRKGVQYLIEALAIVLSVEKEISLVVIGEGEEREVLEKLASERGLDASVEFVGLQPSDKISDWLSQSDCLVLSSLSEGTPNVVLEAMASGLPVVASNLPGIREIVQDGITGLLTKTQDNGELAKKILTIVQNRDQRLIMGKKGREAIQEMGLGWDQVARQYEEVYRKVCAELQDAST